MKSTNGNGSFLFLTAVFLIASSLVATNAEAALFNGAPALDVVGQYSDDLLTVPSYVKGGENNGPNSHGFSNPRGSLIDTVNHRLFISDSSNNRVLVYLLDASNDLIDHVPDYVIGQTDFNSGLSANTQSGLNNPAPLALDPTTDRLFVGESSGRRVKVFDVSTSTMSNGMSATHVIGQASFTETALNHTQSGLVSAEGLALDLSTNRLFVAESSGNRVKVFDISTSTITNGMNAVNVLGQSTWSGSTAANTQSGLRTPSGLAFDPLTNHLFVAETSGHRAKVFDVSTSTIIDGMNAVNILGQSTWTGASNASSNTQSGLRSPQGASFDTLTRRLFISESGRIKIFDLSTTTVSDNMLATNQLGQVPWTGSSPSQNNTPSGLNTPITVAIDSANDRIFVPESGANRIKIFDVATSTITNGQDAVNLMGQYQNALLTVPSYANSSANGGPGLAGLNNPKDVLVDERNHRLFIADWVNHRVIVHELDSSNQLVDYIPDNVIGQPDFFTASTTPSQSIMTSPSGLALDSATNRLFVSNSSRVLVFDISSISDGMNASHVLGKLDFTGTATGNNQSSFFGSPEGLAFDPATNRLFVAEPSGHRVKVFDVSTSTISNGMLASNVIGQLLWTTTSSGNTQSTLNGPEGLAFDPATNRLFVSEANANRVKVFDVSTSTISNGMLAVNVLGQSDFTSSGTFSGGFRSGLASVSKLAFDPVENRLFVSGYGMVKVFNMANGLTDGMPASSVLGAEDWSGTGSSDAQDVIVSGEGVSYDSTSGRLYVMESSPVNRMKIFDATLDDTAPGISGLSASADASSISVSFGSDENAVGSVTYGVGSATLSTASSSLGTSHSLSISGLAPCTVYSYSVSVMDQPENLTVATSSVTTGGCSISSFDDVDVSVSGDTFAFEGLSVTLPSGYYSSDASFQAALLAELPVSAPSGLSPVGDSYRLSAFLGPDSLLETLDATSTVGISYADASLAGIGQGGLAIYSATSSQDGWSLVESCSIDDVSRVISCPVVSLPAYFSIFGASLVSSPEVATSRKPSSSRSRLTSGLTTQAALSQSSVSSGIRSVSRNMTMGSSGPDVRDLQKFLNAQGFAIAGSGAGSSGNETEYFGSLTRSALARFQAAHGISPAVGYFGPITRMAVDLLISTAR